MTTTQLSFGSQITASVDALQVRTMADVVGLISTDAALEAANTRLRKLCQFDTEAYKTVKTRLPYVVGSTFRADEMGVQLRRTDRFVAAHYFILDLDHCEGLTGVVPNAIRQDVSVEMAFVSPGGNGIKVFCRLLEPCHDPKQFSTAYRHFASDFATRHRFTRSIDLRTSDVTRACFLAHDPAVYFNPDAFSVDWQLWLSNDEELPMAPSTPEPVAPLSGPKPINELAYQAVLKQVNPQSTAASRRPKQVLVPDELLPLQDEVRALCQQLNWELKAIEKLNYGLKFCIRQGYRAAEVNAFYGKKGFSLVRSPKTGTDSVLADLLFAKLFGLLFPETVVQEVPLSDALTMN